MGTRSLLGYELPNGKIYAQYLQFDGYPEGQGRDFYVETVKGLDSIQHSQENSFLPGTKVNKPSPLVFKRIKALLNEYQYKSGHSVNSHFTTTREKWFNNKIDSWQEWQYLFTIDGDFIILAHGENSPQIIIPWEITRNILKERTILEGLSKNDLWWEAIKFNDREENKKVLKWGKDAALYINEELEYDSSKKLLEQLLKGGNKPTLPEPIFRINTGEIMGFPEQGNEGYRSFQILTIGTTTETKTHGSTFADKTEGLRNQKTVEAYYLFDKKRIRS